MSVRFRLPRRSAFGLAVIACLALAMTVSISAAEPPSKPEDSKEDSKKGEAKPEQRQEPEPDLHFDTLEDLYGDSGNKFQAAVGIINAEKATATEPDPVSGYGLGVDDMVIEWREFELVQDGTSCASSGECAVLDAQAGEFYEGSMVMAITVLEKTPPTENDCDFDGTPDTGVTDCDSDGVRDLVVKAWSEVEISGELVYVNWVGGYEYKADLPVSTLYDVDGVLFLQPQGTDQPTAQVLYMDDDDGTGNPCRLSVDGAADGRVESGATFDLTAVKIVVVGTALSDNGDDDGWADTNETVRMYIKLGNNSRSDLTDISARLLTNDPKIECITKSAINFGDLPRTSSLLSTDYFEFKVANVDRTGSGLTELDDFFAEFTINLAGGGFDTPYAPQTVTLDLDLDATGGSGPGAFYEGFESGTFGAFTSMNIDAGKSNATGSEGFRCQYSDPDWHNSNSYQQIADCWLAATPAQADAYWWQISNGNSTNPAGRSYDGQYSAYMGYWHPGVSAWTTPLAVLEGLALNNSVNIGWDRICELTRTTPCTGDGDCPGGESCVGVTPELSFKHQVSLSDSRFTSTPAGESADGTAISVQLATAAGVPVGDWIKMSPYLNVYDAQRSDNFTNCFFDPTDDGNNEDDFFDPSDPERRLGPSTLCFPEFSYVWMGSTVGAFSESNLGNAEGPGLEGNKGEGTWVETKVNFARFKGRAVRIRFINSAIKAGTAETAEDLFQWNPIEGDDGWWVDEVRISDTLATGATVSNDDQDNSGLPGCGGDCTVVTASLVADPSAGLPAPGQVVELSAIASTADRCLGTLQYQFYKNGVLLRSWSDNPIIVDAPLFETDYSVDVRCTSVPGCTGSRVRTVPVLCPTSGTFGRALGEFSPNNTNPLYRVGWMLAYAGSCSNDPGDFCTSDADCAGGTCDPADSGELLLSWPDEEEANSVRITRTLSGDGEDFQQTGGKANGHMVVVNDWQLQSGRGFRDPTPDPASGRFNWYLMTHDSPECNVGGSWQTDLGSEPDRDLDLP